MTAARPLFFGLDFDNTIACYDRVFPTLAAEQGLLPAGLAATKKAVRDELRRRGEEDRWTELQGYVYGPGMKRAELFPGLVDFLALCRGKAVPVAIVSHRTRYPYLGEKHDLHASAQRWIDHMGLLCGEGGLRRQDVYLELSKEAKLARIAALGCTHFVDDLPEFLAEPAFPTQVTRLLFDPADQHPGEPFRRVRSWAEVARLLEGWLSP